MSFTHMKLVIDHSATAGPARAILLVLAYRANEHGECWPSLTRIALDSGLDRRTVYRYLPSIVATGELQIEHRCRTIKTRGGDQTSNLYKIALTVPKGGDCLPLPCSAKEEAVCPQGRGGLPPKVGTDSLKGRDQLSPESSVNSHTEPSSEPSTTSTDRAWLVIEQARVTRLNLNEWRLLKRNRQMSDADYIRFAHQLVRASEAQPEGVNAPFAFAQGVLRRFETTADQVKSGQLPKLVDWSKFAQEVG